MSSYDPNGGRQSPPPPYNPSAPAPHAAYAPAPPQGYYYAAPAQGQQQGPPPAGAYAYTVPPPEQQHQQQYAGMPPPPPQAGYHYGQPAPAVPVHHQQQGGKVQPMEVQQHQGVYVAPPSGGGPPQGTMTAGAQGAADGSDGKARYQDVWAALLFLLHVAAIVYFAVVPGLKALRSGQLGKPEGASGANAGAGGDPNGADSSLSTNGMAAEYAGIALVLGAATCWCALWLTVLLKNAGNMIKAAFFGSMATSALSIAGALFYGNLGLAVVCAFGLAINAMYFYCVRNRIPFAAANLKCAASAVLKHKSLLCLAGVMALVQVGWVLLWQLAALGAVFTKGEEVVVINNVTYLMSECADDLATTACYCSQGPNGLSGGTQAGLCKDVSTFQTAVSPLAVFLLLVSMFWGSLVAKNVLFCTVAGTVADWWYNGDEGENVVRRSFLRATTTSFGSICFGSLILAVLRATREMVKAADRQDERGNNAARAIAQCLLGCIDRLMEIFNRYTLVYASIFGNGFIESGRKAFDMFKTSGLSAIINDDLAETALNLVAFVVALLTAVVGYIYGKIFFPATSDWPVVLAVVGFFAGLFLALLAMSVIDAGVASIYVLNAEDPEAFMRTHPALFVELNNAWAAIGYNAQTKLLTRP